MGEWTYYIVKMRMREVASEVKFGSEVFDDFTLDEAIQRTIQESRVRKALVTYLIGRDERFFPSLVVTAIGSEATFFPVSVSDDPHFMIFSDDQSFGFLRFSGNPDYYALDGQHRLKAIKTLLQPDNERERVDPPVGFANEEISVLMMIRPPDLCDKDWRKSCRRLFTSLNRYAKPTDDDTNIIMDEDDTFAILTRRLIAEHDFFKAPGPHKESFKVQTKGKTLREGSSHFTTLQQLYDLNENLLTTPFRINVGWGPETERDVKQFKRFFPSDEYIDELFEELVLYWDALIEAIPDLSLKPSDARNHQADGADGTTADNVLFWPIGQAVMIHTARALLNRELPDPNAPMLKQAVTALRPLRRVGWGLHQLPWRGLLLVSAIEQRGRPGREGQTSGNRKWRMRSEGRNDAIYTAKRVLRWITGLDQTDEREEEALREEWEDQLNGMLPPDENSGDLWHKVRELREHVSI